MVKPKPKRKPRGAIDIQPEGPHVPAMPSLQGNKVISPVTPVEAGGGTYNRPPPKPMPMPSKPMKTPKPKPAMPKA